MPTTNKSITHYFGESDSAMALAAKLDPLFNHLWFLGNAARAYAFQLNKPKSILIGINSSGLNREEIEAVVGVYDVDGIPVQVYAQDVAGMIAESTFAGEGIAVKLSNGGLCISPEFWNLPPETRIRESEDAEEGVVNVADTAKIEELMAFTAEMRQRELEMQTAKVHFERLQAEENIRLANEAAEEPENQQLELALGENSV